MKELIISDIHDDIITADRILDRVPHDHVTLLGDAFDGWHTGVDEAYQTARWMQQQLNNPDVNILLGNHDMSYGWGHLNRSLLCSGWTREKALAVHEILGPADWQKFKLHSWVDHEDHSWLLSHAGIHPTWLAGIEPEDYREVIDRHCACAWKCLNTAQNHFLLNAGRSRGGYQEVGGINWMDWDEFVAIPGINQLVGHSFNKKVRIKGFPSMESDNICLDTHLRHYAVLEDGEMTVYETKDLLQEAA